ncbi:MAG: hypothetical protein LBI13_03920 [Streptococcaceae bacterium]|nr:hypothetical protein [Streptococcaceae bacterium]
MKSNKRFVGIISAIGVVVMALGIFLSQTQIVKDQVTVLLHPLNRQVKVLAKKAELTSEGEFLLQASLAKIENKPSNKMTVTDLKTSGLAGNYTDKKIIIYAQGNQSNQDVEAVTAVHEMLHAAYDRFSSEKKLSIDKAIKSYVNETSDSTIKTVMKHYSGKFSGVSYAEFYASIGSLTDLDEVPYILSQSYKIYLHSNYAMYSLNVSQAVVDQITAWREPLSADLVSISKEAGLNSYAKFLLAASQTELQGSDTFSPNSLFESQDAVIEGYYTPSTKRIYVFKVTNPEVTGMMSVTTAHEMLHAAYDRLSDSDRAKVDAMIRAYIPNIKNPDIKDVLKIYGETEPGQEINELHSLLATEEANLPKGLEDYYKRYFTDRAAVVAINAQQSAIFDNIKNQINALKATMDGQLATIKANEAAYDAQAAQLSSDVAIYNAGGAGSYTSLLARQNALNGLAATINAEIDEYNAEVPQINALGGQANGLASSIGKTGS